MCVCDSKQTKKWAKHIHTQTHVVFVQVENSGKPNVFQGEKNIKTSEKKVFFQSIIIKYRSQIKEQLILAI